MAHLHRVPDRVRWPYRAERRADSAGCPTHKGNEVDAVLTISKLDARSIDYYEKGLDQEEGRGLLDDGYYGEGGDSVPEAWIAARPGEDESAVAAAAAGPGVKRGQLLEASETRAWLGECKSCDGERSLGREPSAKSVRGFDLTFAAPKSVSMVWALADRETRGQVESAVTEARQAALDYLVEHAGYSRVHDLEATAAKREELAAAGRLDLTDPASKGRGQVKRLVPVEGLSGAVYEHHESRTLDPHLHSHTLLSNRAFVAENQQWQTIDGTSLYNEAKSAGSLYQAVLRSALTRDLGVEWAAVDEATGMADLAGISRENIDAASTRHSEITEWAEKYLGRDPTAAQSTAFAQKITRRTKNHQSAETMRESWEKSEWAKGVDLEAILGNRSQSASQSASAAFEGDWAGEILDGIARTESVFARRHVIVAVAARMPVTADTESLLAEVEARADEVMSDARMLTVSGDPLQIESGERRADERESAQIFTSSAIVEQEIRFLDQAMEVAEHRASALSPVDRAVLLDSFSRMSVGQRGAVERTLDSGGLVTPIVAPAGAGKTSAIMVPLREAYEAEGRKVIGLTTAAAAGNVMRQEGAVESARTVASMLRAIDTEAEGGKSAGWSARTVVMLDEAGMTGNADLARLTEYAKQSGAKIIAVGDWAQLGAVKARGGMFRLLCEDAPDVSDLRDEAHRQNDPEERAASLAVRDGSDREREAAADWYTDNGRVESGSPTVMLDHVYEAWSADKANGMDSLLLTATREMANTLNTRAQHDQRAAAWVAMHRDEYGDEAQARAAFDELQPDVETVDVGSGGKVAVGEPLLTRENDHGNVATLEDGTKAGAVLNGQRWMVRELRRDGSVVAERSDDGAIATLKADYLQESSALGWASTVHSAQGMTADSAHAILDGDTATRSMAYVAMTRGRETNRVYLYERRIGEAAHEHRNLERDPDQTADDLDTAGRRFSEVLDRNDQAQTAHEAHRESVKRVRNEQPADRTRRDREIDAGKTAPSKMESADSGRMSRAQAAALRHAARKSNDAEQSSSSQSDLGL